MKQVLTLLIALFASTLVQAQDPDPNVGRDLLGTSWMGRANAGGTQVFLAMEFPAETPGEVLLTMPNALALRQAFSLSGTNESITISVSVASQRILLQLKPELDRNPPQLSGDFEVLGADGESVGQAFSFVMKPWTPPEEMQNQELLSGTVTLPGAQELKMMLRLGSSGERASARIDIPAQSVRMYPCQAVRTENRWRIETNFGTPVLMELAPNPDGPEGAYSGEMEQAGFKMPMVLEVTDPSEAERDVRPQVPKPPFPYAVQEVKIPHPDGHVLAGTFLRPDGDRKPPAVVFITGSGPQNRDEALMGHSPFLVIADYLARNGIASIRYDDRGFGESTGTFADATTEDFATDALAAVAWLRARDDLDLAGIGLLGHSEGGLVAPIAFSMQPREINFAVLLAGPGVDGGRILTSQTERIMEVNGISPEDVAAVVAVHEELMDAVRRNAPVEEIRERFLALTDAQIEISREELGEEKAEEVRAMTLEQIGDKGDPLGIWMTTFIRLDPREFLSQMTCPVLAINGTNDIQVISELNLPEIKRAVTTGGGKVKVKEYDGLNHLFQRAKTGAVSEYAQIETTIEPEVLQDIVTWIHEVTGSG